MFQRSNILQVYESDERVEEEASRNTLQTRAHKAFDAREYGIGMQSVLFVVRGEEMDIEQDASQDVNFHPRAGSGRSDSVGPPRATGVCSG